MSSSGLDWKPLLNAWLIKRPPDEAKILRSYFEKSFPDVYQWTRQNLHYKMDVLECNIIHQVFPVVNLHLWQVIETCQ